VTQQLSHRLILSIFPGIGLLDRAFEEQGFCVVRGPDLLWGGDIRQFHPPPNVFWGVMGGPPCQDFSRLRRDAPTGYGLEMLAEFLRVVTEAQPEWWLMENVDRVPTVSELGHTAGYVTQRFDINQAWYCDVSRFPGRVTAGAALANDSRPFKELCRLQGLPDDFDLPPFLATEKKRAVGNGVPMQIGRELAKAVIRAYQTTPLELQRDFAGLVTPVGVCRCGCGRGVTGKAKYYDYSCRKRAQRNRDKATVTDQAKLNSFV
jgi:DNA (cytosine-5)-methyltransferase 1